MIKVGVLGPDQCNEWRGLMVILFILVRYFGFEKVNRIVQYMLWKVKIQVVVLIIVCFHG